MSVTGIILLVALAALLFYGVSIYNRLVALANRYRNAFAQVEVQLKRRHELVPNLVETAKAYMRHERETLEAVTAARHQAISGLQSATTRPGDAQAMAALANGEQALGAALSRLSLVMEDYPELQASGNMQQLSEELISTENRVAFARQAFNDAVMRYNTYKQSFPPVLLAPSLGHKENAALLSFADSESIQQAPQVAF